MPVTKICVLFFVLFVVAPVRAQDAGVVGGFGGGLTAYDGPPILGRGGLTSGQRGTEAVPIHMQASLNGSYDSNLLGYSVDSNGKFSQAGSFGLNANLGVSGRKNWRRSYLGIDYSGDYSHYTRNSFYNGTNHQLNLGFGRQFGPKWQVNSQLAAGTSNRFIGGQAVFQANEFEFLSAPTAELFDSRSFFIGNSTGATYSFSRRQSIRVAGNGSAVRRRARGLVDMQSYGATADWVYRVSRRTSIGVSYLFSHYDFTKIFGDSDIHTIGVHVGRKVGRDWDVAASLTGAQQSTVGVRTVALDPILAAILGRSSGAEVFESNNLIYGYTFSAVRRIRRSNFNFNAQRGINPGNGYFLTSVSQGGNVGFSHNLSRDLALNGSFGYNKMTSLGFASGALKGWTGGGGVVYKLTESFGLNARYDWRSYDLAGTTFGRTGNRVSMGVTYFPQQSVASLF